MATLTRGQTFGSTEAITNTKLHNLVDLGSVSSIVNADISSSAAIAYSKLNITGGIVNSDISASAAIAYSKLNLATSLVNADISASAAIVASKLDLTSPNGIGTTTPAAGKFTDLEATTTLKFGTTHQGDIFYDNGTSIVRLTPGTAGQGLITNGAGANPSWGNAGALSLVSATSMSSVSTSSAISITRTEQYKVIVNYLQNSSGGVPSIIFNSVTSGSHYAYTYNGTASATSAAANTLIISPSTGSGAYNSFEFEIRPQLGSGGYIGLSGAFTGGGNLTNFVGTFESANVTDFEITTSGGSMTGTVYLYKYSQS